MLNNTGVNISKPLNYSGGIIKDPTSERMMSHNPLYIPWSALTQCIQTETKLITMPVKNTDVSLQLALWGFLSPLCEEKGIPTLHEKQKDTVP